MQAPAAVDSPVAAAQDFQAELDTLYEVTPEAVDFYHKQVLTAAAVRASPSACAQRPLTTQLSLQGYVRLHNVFSPQLLEAFAAVVTEAVAQVQDGVSLEDDDDYARAFKQARAVLS